MSEGRVWFITGAGSGMGAALTKAALAAGNKVVATGRNPEAVAKTIGDAEHLLVARRDVTNPEDAETAVNAAVERFGRMDVLRACGACRFNGEERPGSA